MERYFQEIADTWEDYRLADCSELLRAAGLSE
jgi:hypothetical protein